MATKRRQLYYRRRFLNPPRVESFGAIIAQAERIERTWKDKKKGTTHRSVEVLVDLDLSDCNRVIYLSFPTATRAQRRRTLAKLDLLAGTIAGLREAVIPEFEALDRTAPTRRRRPWDDDDF